MSTAMYTRCTWTTSLRRHRQGSLDLTAGPRSRLEDPRPPHQELDDVISIISLVVD